MQFATFLAKGMHPSSLHTALPLFEFHGIVVAFPFPVLSLFKKTYFTSKVACYLVDTSLQSLSLNYPSCNHNANSNGGVPAC